MTTQTKNTQGFTCSHCGKWVPLSKRMGTKNRNHCPSCLWSMHLDSRPGDRGSACGGHMEPLGLTFKKEGTDKYGKERQGELMLIHKCLKCAKVSINRIAADDNTDTILEVFEKSKDLAQEVSDNIQSGGIRMLTDTDLANIKQQLFGKQ